MVILANVSKYSFSQTLQHKNANIANIVLAVSLEMS